MGPPETDLMARALGLPGCDFTTPFFQEQSVVPCTPTKNQLWKECQRRFSEFNMDARRGKTGFNRPVYKSSKDQFIDWLRDNPITKDDDEIQQLLSQVEQLKKRIECGTQSHEDQKECPTENQQGKGGDGACDADVDESSATTSFGSWMDQSVAASSLVNLAQTEGSRDDQKCESQDNPPRENIPNEREEKGSQGSENSMDWFITNLGQSSTQQRGQDEDDCSDADVNSAAASLMSMTQDSIAATTLASQLGTESIVPNGSNSVGPPESPVDGLEDRPVAVDDQNRRETGELSLLIGTVVEVSYKGGRKKGSEATSAAAANSAHTEGSHIPYPANQLGSASIKDASLADSGGLAPAVTLTDDQDEGGTEVSSMDDASAAASLSSSPSTAVAPPTAVQHRKREEDLIDDASHGFAHVVWSNGTSYKGEFRDGLRDGWGRYAVSEDSYYEGMWAKDKFEGDGKLVCRGKVLHDGFWKDSNPVFLNDASAAASLSSSSSTATPQQSNTRRGRKI